jgi:putative glycosyltransferase (TIGR04372 family)
LNSSRIGHFATNTELYLCECDAKVNVPQRRYIDLCYFAETPIANIQLARMWRRQLRVWPAWLLHVVLKLNRLCPRGEFHIAGNNTNSDRDVHGLLAQTSPHLSFTAEEEWQGIAGLRSMGIPDDAEFICMAARDSAYLMTPDLKALIPNGDPTYHNFRDVDAQNLTLAVQALAERGYYVLRMGVVVKKSISIPHPKVIDYATNGMRSDFMDIYLGAKCMFFISCGTGIDAIATAFRKPIANVNYVPVGYFSTYLHGTVGIFKKHWLVSENRVLTLKEIFSSGVGSALASADYEERGVELIENTPEEIKSLVIEMLERLQGTWQPEADDEALQRKFWEIYPSNLRDEVSSRPLHGQVRARCGTQFLRDNPSFLI